MVVRFLYLYVGLASPRLIDAGTGSDDAGPRPSVSPVPVTRRHVAHVVQTGYVSHSSERTFPVRAILRVPFLANGWDPREAQHSWALLTLWRVPSYSQCSQAPSRSREKVRTSLHEWQRGGRRRRRGQSHSEELPLCGRRWPPMACRSPQTSSVLLWCAWRPSSSSSSRRGLATVTVIGLGS